MQKLFPLVLLCVGMALPLLSLCAAEAHSNERARLVAAQNAPKVFVPKLGKKGRQAAARRNGAPGDQQKVSFAKNQFNLQLERFDLGKAAKRKALQKHIEGEVADYL